jgi:hypothetical protein
VTDDGSVPLLVEIAAEQEPLVAEAARSLMQAREHTFTAPHVREGASEHNGDRIHANYRGPVGSLSHRHSGHDHDFICTSN